MNTTINHSELGHIESDLILEIVSATDRPDAEDLDIAAAFTYGCALADSMDESIPFEISGPRLKLASLAGEYCDDEDWQSVWRCLKRYWLSL